MENEPVEDVCSILETGISHCHVSILEYIQISEDCATW